MHQYQLQRYSGANSKHRCPQCQNRRKTLSLYIDAQTNQLINPNVGRCDREVKCGYHYTPKQYFADNSIAYNDVRKAIPKFPVAISHTPIAIQEHPPSTIADDVFKRSLSRYEQNNLVEFLKFRFGNTVTDELIAKYFIGTAKHWHGATVFWQVDINGNVRTGKVMLYNPTDAKRVKQPFNHITWVHTLLRKRYETLDIRFETGGNNGAKNLNAQISILDTVKQCFFGEHLLRDTTKPVALVESEKTALIASIMMPSYTWIATGGLSNLTSQKCTVLQGRKVYLYPDVNAFDAWQVKAHELKPTANFILFPLLEQIANAEQRTLGLDIADYLMGLCPF
jgi:hypothetical protein